MSAKKISTWISIVAIGGGLIVSIPMVSTSCGDKQPDEPSFSFVQSANWPTSNWMPTIGDVAINVNKNNEFSIPADTPIQYTGDSPFMDDTFNSLSSTISDGENITFQSSPSSLKASNKYEININILGVTQKCEIDIDQSTSGFTATAGNGWPKACGSTGPNGLAFNLAIQNGFCIPEGTPIKYSGSSPFDSEDFGGLKSSFSGPQIDLVSGYRVSSQGTYNINISILGVVSTCMVAINSDFSFTAVQLTSNWPKAGCTATAYNQAIGINYSGSCLPSTQVSFGGTTPFVQSGFLGFNGYASSCGYQYAVISFAGGASSADARTVKSAGSYTITITLSGITVNCTIVISA